MKESKLRAEKERLVYIWFERIINNSFFKKEKAAALRVITKKYQKNGGREREKRVIVGKERENKLSQCKTNHNNNKEKGAE